MRGEPQVLYSGAAAERKLGQLGLSVPCVHDILMVGHAERATYTRFDARGAGEYARWSRHVRRASEILVPEGWTRIDPDGQPTLVHPSNKWCLVVASGNSATGVPYATPTTRNPKGRTIRDAVQENAEMALFGVEELAPALEGMRETWMLLAYANMDDMVQAEVSLPDEMTGDFIASWRDRILIPTLDPSAGPARRGGEEEPPDYEFKIVRR
jgi:hypothetical protein